MATKTRGRKQTKLTPKKASSKKPRRKAGARTNRTPQRARASKLKSRTAWHERFIRTYAKTGNISLSCRAARIGRQTYYDHLEKHPQFQIAVDEAKEAAIDELEAAARKRALKSSDTLMTFLLKSLRPDIYRETVNNKHSGSVTIDVSKLTDEELRAIAQA